MKKIKLSHLTKWWKISSKNEFWEKSDSIFERKKISVRFYLSYGQILNYQGFCCLMNSTKLMANESPNLAAPRVTICQQAS
jgi:hypothetical protein